MKSASLLAVTAVALAAQMAAPRPAQSQDGRWRVRAVRHCRQADSLVGRLYRSHPVGVRSLYVTDRDTTIVRTRLRTGSWQPSASTRLVGTEAGTDIPGRDGPAAVVRVELSLRFLDSLPRTPEQARLTLVLDGRDTVVIEEPRVDYAVVASAQGVPLVVTALLTADQSRALARARDVRGVMGPFPFFLYDWELWDINAVFRAGLCGID